MVGASACAAVTASDFGFTQTERVIQLGLKYSVLILPHK
jgi:hypothetical protein